MKTAICVLALMLSLMAPTQATQPYLPPSKVVIAVDSTPAGADVYGYDGRSYDYLGRTPAGIAVDPTHSMTMTLKLDGFNEANASTGVKGDPKHPLDAIHVRLTPNTFSSMLWYYFQYRRAAAWGAAGCLLLALGTTGWLIWRRMRSLRQEAIEAHLSNPDLCGRLVGDYRVKSLLGEGAFARVYLVEHEKYGDRFALKLLRPEFTDDEAAIRFAREIEVGRDLTHPNLARVCAFGDVDGCPYLVMEYLDGQTLRQRMDAGRLPLEEAVAIFRQICQGVAFAHAHGVVHRDLKPENIMLMGTRVCVMDFGIAKLTSREKLTATGTSLGTPLYMSPEHTAAARLDARSDIYSLGVILYEMLSGQVPFPGDEPMAVIAGHMRRRPPPLRSISPHLEALTMRMLEKKPERRYQTLDEVVPLLSENPLPVASS